MVALTFALLLGYLLCFLQAYLERRKQSEMYATLQEDYRKVINEFSIRTNGRTIYKQEENKDNQVKGRDAPNQGEFNIYLPSMAEADAETITDIDDLPEGDVEHLRKTGVLG